MHMTQLIPGDTRYPYETMPTSRCYRKVPRHSDGRSAIPSLAAIREDSSVDSALACPASWREHGYHEGEEAFANCCNAWGEHF